MRMFKVTYQLGNNEKVRSIVDEVHLTDIARETRLFDVSSIDVETIHHCKQTIAWLTNGDCDGVVCVVYLNDTSRTGVSYAFSYENDIYTYAEYADMIDALHSLGYDTPTCWFDE